MKPVIGFESEMGVISSAVKLGKYKTAINALSRIEYGTVPRGYLSRFADMANQAKIPLMALKILHPVVRGEGMSPTGEELLQYAVGLIAIGAVGEAQGILREERSDWPEARPLHLAQTHLEMWDTRAGQALLEKFVQERAPRSDAYTKAAELLSFCHRFHGEFDKALQVLKATGLETEQHFTSLVRDVFVHGTGEGLSFLRQISAGARESGSFGKHREAEFYIAVSEKNSDLIAKLFYGTPFEGFRERLLQALPNQWELPVEYRLGQGESRIFDLFLGIEVGDPEKKLKVGQILHRLLVSLTADIYRPARVASVFERVFQGENFDPKTSPGRVHQIVKRLKKTLVKMAIPIEIEEKGGMYAVRIKDDYSLRISRQHLKLRKRHPLYVRLELALPADNFSIQQAAEALGLSRRFARKILERAEHHGWVQMKGRGRTTRYEFTRIS